MAAEKVDCTPSMFLQAESGPYFIKKEDIVPGKKKKKKTR